jgi:2-succinyl-6-hydroxy-2,4-cyclohexadiene-1-carboxylate synthase
VTNALGERYRALAPDIRGHGAAADRRPVDLEHVVADLSELTSESFTLVGYSMGGRIALHASLALAPSVLRLVLIGASPGIADCAERAQRRAADERLASDIERSTVEEFAVAWARTPVLSGQPAAVADAVHVDRLRNTPAGLARALRGLGTGALPSLWARLGELAVPTTFIAGERDRKFSELARAMGAAMPEADVVIVPDAGHAVHLEAPEAVAAVIAGRPA